MKNIGLSPYFLLGYPNTETCLELIDISVKQGVSMIEVGIPFSEPQADGPVLTAINCTMVDKGFSVQDALILMQKIKIKYPQLKITLMSYINPLLHYGLENFFLQIEDLVDYILIPDLPLEEIHFLPETSCKRVMIVGDTMTDQEIKMVIDAATGFLYVMTSVSTTGNIKAFPEKLNNLVQTIQKYNTKGLPLCAGFGIRTNVDIKRLEENGFDGYIVGTKLVEAYNNGGGIEFESTIKGLVGK